MRFEPDHTAIAAFFAEQGAEMVKPHADHVAEVARGLAPRSSAEHEHMADSIKAVRAGPTEYHVSFDKDHWYGVFAETGTEKEAPRPFLRPALDSIGGRVAADNEE